MVMERFALTERRACKFVGQPRAGQRYVPVELTDEAPLVKAIVDLDCREARERTFTTR